MFILKKSSGTLEDGGLSCYGTSVELPGGDVQLPSGTSSIILKLEEEVPNKVNNLLDYESVKLNCFWMIISQCIACNVKIN